MPLPVKHRAALVKEFGKPLVVEEIPTPEPRDRQVLIKVVGAGICHTDVHVWKGDWSVAGIPPKLPFILSHEVVGTIAAKGDKVPDDLKEGRNVLVYAWQWSRDDVYVAKGLTQLSEYPAHMAIVADGGMQEYYLVSDYRFLVSVDGLEDLPAVAPLACAGLTTYRAVKRILSHLEPDDYVAVIGLGGLGSYAIQWIRALAPYVNLIGVAGRDESLEFASRIVKLDATVNTSKVDPAKAIMEITKGRGLKAVVDTVGTETTIMVYTSLLTKMGVHMIVGMIGGEAKISPLLPFIVNERILTGSIVGSLGEQIDVVTAAKRGMVNYRAVVTRRLKLEEVTEGLEALEKRRALGRQVVVL
ncbi:MAG: alcohol dehydrogenase catalytic domain-containing protein [Ignisphaera sp.]|nr:alcohol dehydrogenase catalytic domain-containing protein [Ignisphaera sp.]MDW8085987.1 alcohol dehydrogenase catalytic domain-containing protein [Ignisphaera sp.]